MLFLGTISGWYFGKTGGLLGIYDNEPSNDWMTPQREVVDDIKTFATSWQVVIIILPCSMYQIRLYILTH